jgi:hypothetical protein
VLRRQSGRSGRLERGAPAGVPVVAERLVLDELAQLPAREAVRSRADGLLGIDQLPSLRRLLVCILLDEQHVAFERRESVHEDGIRLLQGDLDRVSIGDLDVRDLPGGGSSARRAVVCGEPREGER